MALDAVVKELLSRNIVKADSAIVLPLNTSDKFNVVLIKYLSGVARQYKVEIIFREISDGAFI